MKSGKADEYAHDPHQLETLVELLRFRARQQPNRAAYTFLADGEHEAVSVTYRELDVQARSIGAELQRVSGDGERALLLYPPGLEYIAAFFGCLYSGRIAVPMYPPQRQRSLGRVKTILSDAQAAIVLSTSPIRSKLDRLLSRDPELERLRLVQYLETDQIDHVQAEHWQEPFITPDTLAYLQYTSGSTGLPKGVMLSHHNLLHNQRLIQSGFGHCKQTIVVGWLPLYHDMGLIGNILQPLYLGVPGILMSPYHFLQQPLRWLEAISRYRATTSGGPNFAYDLCVRRITPEQRAKLDLSCWRVAFNGAEPVRAGTLERFAQTFRSCGFRREALYPCYGLAEATLMVAGGLASSLPTLCHVQECGLEQHRVVEGTAGEHGVRTLVSSGCAQLDQRILIVHPEALSRCPDGEVGEIWVQGASVAQGYWGRTDETAATFGARLRESGEGPFLRTGDLGFLRGGELFVTGRLKDLIIIRGRNHYPHDIELTVETSHAALRPGCGAAFSVEVDEEERLVVVHEVDPRVCPDMQALAAVIRSAVAEQHDVHVDAVALIRAGSLPKTSSGKIQRQICRMRYLARTLQTVGEARESATTIGAPAVSPLTPLEQTLANIWAEVLGRDHIGRHERFFALGGDSLRAIQVISRVQEAFRFELSVDRLFEFPTVAALAGFIAEEIGRRGAADDPDKPMAPPAVATGPIAVNRSIPLSFAQQRLWFLDQLMPGVPISNIPVALQMCGPLNVAALRQAVTEIVRRHETLRTSFTLMDGQPVQIIAPPSPVEVPISDLRGMSESERKAQAARLTAEAARQPFDLAHGPLLRVGLLQLEAREHILLLTVHHIIADDWSMGILSRELAILYATFSAGTPSPLGDLAVQYRDIAREQRERLQGDRLAAQLSYWKGRLTGSPSLLNLPTDRPRLPTPTYRGARRPVVLSRSLTDPLKALAERQGATLFMVLLAAFQVLLHRYSGQDDISVGSSLANRQSIEAEKLIGFFANLLVFRVRLVGDPTFLALLGTVRETALGAYAHQDLPFEMLVEALQPERDMSRTPLFQASLVLQNAPPPTLALSGLTVNRLESHSGTSQFDLTLSLTDEAGQLAGSIEYSMDLFEETTIARLTSNFETLLEAVLEQPDRRISELPLLAEQERQQILRGWNATQRIYPHEQCIHELIEAQAGRRPEALAVVLDEERLTYRELTARANQLAHYLRRWGVGPDVLVGISVERSLDMVVGLLAILKAGGAYVPIDPDSPQERVAFMLQDAGMAVLLTHYEVAGRLPAYGGHVLCLDSDRAVIEQESPSSPGGGVSLQNLAYTIYTSGSTGRPKGAWIPHAGLLNRLQWMQEYFRLTSDDRVLQKTPFSFDVSVWEFFWPLMTGARLVLARPGDHKNAERLVELIRQQQITTLHFVPPMLQTFLETPGIKSCGSLRRVICSGETLPVELQRRFYERMDAELHNLYGPTEASIDVTAWACKRDDPGSFVPIGRPIANTQIYLLDGHLEPVPIGVPGDLYIGGDGVGRGYLNRPDLTAEKFIADPFCERPGARLYKTGDLARFLPDGNILFLGRNDSQVKIRGYRIELGEVEAVLGRHPGVREAVVLAREEREGKRLLAYVVLEEAQETSAGDLRRFMRGQLPDYMVPAVFVMLDALPLTSNGKVDRAALPQSEEVRVQPTIYEAPRSNVEQAITCVWQEVLEVKTVSIHDNFFDLGGQSLLLANVWGKLRGQFQRELTMLDLFQYPTIAALARFITERDTPTAVVLGPGVQSERRKAGQERLRQQHAQRRTAASRQGGTR